MFAGINAMHDSPCVFVSALASIGKTKIKHIIRKYIEVQLKVQWFLEYLSPNKIISYQSQTGGC